MTGIDTHDTGVRRGRDRRDAVPASAAGATPRFVVGVDGSERSLDAVALAQRLAAPTGAAVLVANVCPLSFYLPAEAATGAGMRYQAERRIERLRPALDGMGPWEPRIVDGSSAARGLHELAIREHADLLVIGSTHRGPVGRVVPGTVARRLLHGSPCPVLIAPRGYRPPPRDRDQVIGVAFDGSPESQEALGAAARWAQALDASLRIITVLTLPSPGNPAFGTVSYRDTVGDLREAARMRLEAATTGVRVPAAVSADVLEGDPVSVLAAESRVLDLLLVGSRSYGPVRSVLLGSVSTALVERVACPVLVMPRGPQRGLRPRTVKHPPAIAV
jgi:nucleotide-binding universal stress UspA family protein